MGDNTIHYRGHIHMMAAVQPFISGAISKTVNLPEEATVEEVEQLHIEAWQLGLKAVAIYRDNCKVAQPLATTKKAAAEPAASAAEAHDAELAVKVAELEKALERQTVVVKQPIRERLPRKRKSSTFKFRVADCEGYVTVGEYDDGRPGEVFMKVSKQGSTLAGIMDAFADRRQPRPPARRAAGDLRQEVHQHALRAGRHDRRSRAAHRLSRWSTTSSAGWPSTTSPYEERAELGVLTTEERMQPTLPGVEEAATPELVDRRGHRLDAPEHRARPPAAGRSAGTAGAADPGRPGRCSVLLPVRRADAASRQLLRLPVVRDHQRLLVAPSSEARYWYQWKVSPALVSID